MKQLSLAIALALCLALPASAQMYKWVDANGKVQYSDKPPPSNIKAEKLRAPVRAAGAPAASEGKGAAQKDAAKTGPKTAAEQDQAFRKRQMDAAKAQEDEGKLEPDLDPRRALPAAHDRPAPEGPARPPAESVRQMA